MKIISGKLIFASLIFLLIMSFVVNNFFNNNVSFSEKDKQKFTSTKRDKIIGVEIRQQNQNGDNFLIVADTLEELESKENKLILENSITTINQRGIVTKIFAGKALITNNYNDFSFSNKVKIKKKQESSFLKLKH